MQGIETKKSKARRRITAFLMATILAFTVMNVYAATIKQVMIKYDGITLDIRTIRNTVGEVLEDYDVPVGEYDRVDPPVDTLLDYSMTVEIIHPVRATITEMGQTRQIYTAAANAKDALAQYGVYLNPDDMLSCRLEDPVVEGMDLLVTRVTWDYYEENIVLPCEVEMHDNPDLPWGTENVIEEGGDGVMVRGTKIMYCDGVEQDRLVVKEERVREPKKWVVERGIKNAHVTASGEVIRYKKVITCEATAYDPTHQSPNDPYYGLTAIGTRVRVGAVAVDPRVIPLRSKLYIEAPDGSWTYGYALAEDTGGAIKGNRVDLFYNTAAEAIRFGRRPAKIYVLE